MNFGETLRLLELAKQENPVELEEGFTALSDCSSIS